MSLRPNWISLAFFCVLPALGVQLQATHSSFVASFFYACAESPPAPRVRVTRSVASRPAPRPKYSPVAVFERGHAPTRHYQLLGEVQVLARAHMSIQELTDYAIRSARQMGGDAIVDVAWDDAASTHPPAGDLGQLVLTASVARWE